MATTLARQVDLKANMSTQYRARRLGTAALSMGEVAAAAGLHASAIRYYEDAGILPKPDRVSGKRRYHPDTIDRLTLIRFCSRLGMRLTDIRGLLTTPRGTRAKEDWRRLVDGKLDEIAGLINAA